MASPATAAPAAKFSVYQNPAFSTALKARSVDPSPRTFIAISSAVAAAAVALLVFSIWGHELVACLGLFPSSKTVSYYVVKVVQIGVGLVFLASLTAFVQALLFRNAGMTAMCRSLSPRQLVLLGIKPKPDETVGGRAAGKTVTSPAKKWLLHPEPLVPIHPHFNSGSGGSRSRNFSGGSPYSPLVTRSGISLSSSGLRMNISPSRQSPDSMSTPWSKQAWSGKSINSEAVFEEFLKDTDETIDKFGGALLSVNSTQATPPSTLGGRGVMTPGPSSISGGTPGTARSTPLRPMRMSPLKYITPPKRGEGEFPTPFSVEHTIAAYQRLGIYPQIEHWRDRLRQWFSSVLLKPLLEKIEISHLQVMDAAAKLGYSITVRPVMSDSVPSSASLGVSPIDGARECQPMSSVEEEGLLHQLRGALLQARSGSASQLSSTLPNPQQSAMLAAIQECINAIIDHQRLLALMKGDLGRGLLPQSSVRVDFTVQRVQELAEGTCLKNFEYLGNGEVYDKKHQKWTLELPTDSHLLVYLFCAFLEHPKWMLHVDSLSYASTPGINPFFIGMLPPKERCPEKYVAVISSVPSVLHPGACVLSVGRQNPPIFALYWDNKLQFSLQGRSAVWDALLVLCLQVNTAFEGVVRGVHLDSLALRLLPIFETDVGDSGYRRIL